jgi:hypothetical protein
MRTILDIEDDVLQAVKEIASNGRTTAGRVLSELARTALGLVEAPPVRNGVPLLPRRPPGSPRLTLALVNRLREVTGVRVAAE